MSPRLVIGAECILMMSSLDVSFGRGISILRSKRPGRSRAGSRISVKRNETKRKKYRLMWPIKRTAHPPPHSSRFAIKEHTTTEIYSTAHYKGLNSPALHECFELNQHWIITNNSRTTFVQAQRFSCGNVMVRCTYFELPESRLVGVLEMGKVRRILTPSGRNMTKKILRRCQTHDLRNRLYYIFSAYSVILHSKSFRQEAFTR